MIGWRREVAARRLAPLGVELIENTHPDISRSGTTHSVQYAACSSFAPLDGAEPLLVMDGDIVYEQKLMDVVADEDGSSAVVVSPHVRADCEEVRVYGDGRRPRLVGKGLGPPITGSLELLGEATGILRLARSEHDLARALLTWLVGKPDGDRRSFGFAGIGSEHEELAQYLMTLGRLEAVRLDPDLLFMEADFAEDFARLRDEVYPEILRKDSSLE